MSTRPDLSAFIKTYDVRGLVGTQLTDEVVTAIGAAFVDEVQAAGTDVVIGHDMRESSPGFAAAFADGVRMRGGNVVAIGLCSTDQNYYASGKLDAPAAMFTASHNPAAYNGIKLSRAGARGISVDTGLAAIREGAEQYLADGIPSVDVPGNARELDVLADYADYLRELVDLSGIRRLRVVVDAANGMGGHTVPAVLGAASGLPLEIIPLYFELDGSFPNHEANPLDPANLVDLQAAVIAQKADLGLAFDGDADRVFVIDENGDPVTPSAVAAVVAVREIERARARGDDGELCVIHNLITSRAVPEAIAAAGAVPVRTKVGHSLIKDEMAATGAIFGGGVRIAEPAALRIRCALRPVSPERRNQLDRHRRSRRVRAHRRRVRVARRIRRARRTHRQQYRQLTRQLLVVQRAALQHRAAAAPQRRGRQSCAAGGHPRPGACAHPRLIASVGPVALVFVAPVAL